MDERDGREDETIGGVFTSPSVFSFSAGGCTLMIEHSHKDDTDWKPIAAPEGAVPADPTLGVRIRLKFDSTADVARPTTQDHLRRDPLDGASAEA